MTINDVRLLRAAAADRLRDLVKQRNDLLQQLGQMANFAAGFTPDMSKFIDFDAQAAREIIVKVEEITPRINSLIAELNHYSEQLGQHRVDRRSFFR